MDIKRYKCLAISYLVDSSIIFLKVLPATGVPGDCYLLGKSDEEPEIDDEPEAEEEDDGGN